MRLLAFLLMLPALSFAQVPHTFQNGEVADANTVNANFQNLDGRIQAIEDAGGGGGGCTVEQVDSSAEITCADGTTAVVPGYGTVVIIPDGVSGEAPVTNIANGQIYYVDANDVYVAEINSAYCADQTSGCINVPIGTRTVSATLFNTENTVELRCRAATFYYVSDDCSGQPLLQSSDTNFLSYSSAEGYFAADVSSYLGEILVGSSKTLANTEGLLDGECISAQSAIPGRVPVPIEIPVELSSPAYPVRLEQLP